MQDQHTSKRIVEEAVEPGAAWPGLPVDRIGLVVGPLVLLGWLLFIPQGALSPEAHRLAGILLLTVLWWVTEPIPIPVTGLLAIVLCVVLGAVPTGPSQPEPGKLILRPFADPSVFFMIGGLFIGQAMARHGLDRRLALSILCARWAGRSPGTVLAAVGIGVTLISMWISNTSATAMMYPVTQGIIAVLAAADTRIGSEFARSRYASALLLMTAYASSVGGVATPIGTATNIVAIGFFRQELGQSVNFLQWSLVGVSMMAVLFVGLYGWLRLWRPPAGMDLPVLRGYLHDEYERLGRWRTGEIVTLVVFLVVVALWVTPGVLSLVAAPNVAAGYAARFPEAITALLAPVLLFVLPVDWKNRKFGLEPSDLRQIDWGIILLFGSGLALGNLMFQTGLADAVGKWVFGMLGTRDLWVITAVAIVGAIGLSEITGNAAAAATLLPVVLATCKEAEIDPLIPMMAVAFGASFGSALPVSTPPNAIVYSSGLISIRRMVLAGIGLDVICAVVIWVVLRVAYALAWNPLIRQPFSSEP